MSEIPQEMKRVPFSREEIEVLRQSISVAEELISDFYKLSTSEWKRYRYDIQSLKDLLEEEIVDTAFAQVHRYSQSPHQRLRGSERGEFFKICIQDHMVRKAVERDPHIQLFPLMTYIVTHELIHVVRFARFLHQFYSTPAEETAEERRVHALTYQLLENLKIKGLPEVLQAFKNCRTMETFYGTREAASQG